MYALARAFFDSLLSWLIGRVGSGTPATDATEDKDLLRRAGGRIALRLRGSVPAGGTRDRVESDSDRE